MAMSHACSCVAQTGKEPILLGSISSSALQDSPYAAWFHKNYEAYHSNTIVKSLYNKNLLKDISIETFFGSWCGDSKRELPRFVKLLDEIGFDQKQLTIIGLGGSDSLYKRSPQGEEQGKGIFRVPVFIVYKKGKEAGRINEFPVESLERDLLNILQAKEYTPNYKSFSLLNQWLLNGVLADSNISVRGLAGTLKPLVQNEYELNSVARLWMQQYKKEEAFKLLQVNAQLYPFAVTAVSGLAEAYIDRGNKAAAILLLERSLESRPPESNKPLIDLLVKAKL